MKTGISVSSWVFPIILLIAVHQRVCYKQFSCISKSGAQYPTLPTTYSTNIKFNFETSHSTTEVKYAVNNEENKGFLEFKTKDRHVNYIIRGDQKCVLFITYREDEHPTCVVKTTLDMDKYLEEVDAGPNGIIAKTFKVMSEKTKDFYDYGSDLENGMIFKRWEGCFTYPQINVSVSFAAPRWNHPYYSVTLDDSKIFYIEQAEAQILGAEDTVYTAFYSSFDPNTPDKTLFQPPKDVYCDGFRSDKKPPSFPNYFSYNAETLVYESSQGIAPIVSYRKVFYDYKDKISRIDFYDPLAESPDIFAPVTAQEKSIIHDFNAGTQYTIDPILGNCIQDAFQSTFSVISGKETKGNDMLTGNEFFLLDKAKLSYNGQFPVRGMMADVYTSVQEDTQSKQRSVISWYFSAEENRIVETENAEKNVLLRISISPESGDEKEGVVLMNFYNFAKEQPDPFRYDLRSCFNSSFSKVLVLTFPGNNLLKGSEKLVGMLVHFAVTNVTGIAKQRIYVNEVTFDKKYLYVEFDILEAPVTLSSKKRPEAISLTEALNKLKAAVSNGEFSVRVPLENLVVVLKPEPNGLNVFAGDRTPASSLIGYREGSVIFLTVGMLVLGFFLGGVTLNLVISKKFGVSLFQKSKNGNPYSGELNESSM